MRPAFTVFALGLCLASVASPVYAQSESGNAPPKPPYATPLNEDAVAPAPIQPALDADDTPLPSMKVRWHELTHQLFGFQAAFETIPGTAFDMARNFPYEWGRTWPGLGKRYWNQYSQFLLSETIEFGVSAAHHEDPRYFRMGEGGIRRRAWHTIRSTWVARDSSGEGERVALGRIAGVYGAWYIASRWSPDSVHGVEPFLVWGTFGMATKSGANAIREFWPDAKRKFFTKKHD